MPTKTFDSSVKIMLNSRIIKHKDKIVSLLLSVNMCKSPSSCFIRQEIMNTRKINHWGQSTPTRLITRKLCFPSDIKPLRRACLR